MIAAPVLIDTGPLVAVLRAADARHAECVRQLRDLRVPAYTCWPVLTETAYLLRQRPDAIRTLLSRCDGSRFEILPLSPNDLTGVNDVLDKYEDQDFDLADACLMHLAQREGIEHVFTLDLRHFSIFRTNAGRALQLLPGI